MQSSPIPKYDQLPLCLFEKRAQNLSLNKEVLTILATNFKTTQKKIVIIVATGILGTGKSTWLSTLINQSEKPTQKGRFKTGYTQQTETEGLWVYPYPLTFHQYPDVQFMLLDMEGMNGVYRPQEQKQAKECLIKLFTLSLLLSSVFTLHTNFRIDSTTLEVLEQAEVICQQLETTLPISTSQIYIFPRDTTRLCLRDDDHRDPETFYKESSNLTENFLAKVTIRGRPEYPPTFLHSLQKNESYDGLDGSDMQRFNLNFIQETTAFFKRRPGLNQSMDMTEFIKLVTTLSEQINSNNFAGLFTASLEETLTNLARPIFRDQLQTFQSKANNLAKIFDVTNSLDKFQQNLETLRNEAQNNLNSQLKHLLPPKSMHIKALQIETHNFNQLLQSAEPKQLFQTRQTEFAHNQQTKRYQNTISELEEEQKTAQRNFNNQLAQRNQQIEALENRIKSVPKQQTNFDNKYVSIRHHSTNCSFEFFVEKWGNYYLSQQGKFLDAGHAPTTYLRSGHKEDGPGGSNGWQQWLFVETENSTFYIRNFHSGKNLYSTPGGELRLTTGCTANEKWTISIR